MRLNYYRFPEGTDEKTLLKEGCGVVLKDGTEIWPDVIPDDKRQYVDSVNDTLGGISVTRAKQLLKQYGGSALTEHIERDGGLIETSEIKLTGNNSRFKYSHHL